MESASTKKNQVFVSVHGIYMGGGEGVADPGNIGRLTYPTCLHHRPLCHPCVHRTFSSSPSPSSPETGPEHAPLCLTPPTRRTHTRTLSARSRRQCWVTRSTGHTHSPPFPSSRLHGRPLEASQHGAASRSAAKRSHSVEPTTAHPLTPTRLQQKKEGSLKNLTRFGACLLHSAESDGGAPPLPSALV